MFPPDLGEQIDKIAKHLQDAAQLSFWIVALSVAHLAVLLIIALRIKRK